MNTQDAAEIFLRLSCLQRPRPNGSQALAEAVGDVQAWLDSKTELLDHYQRGILLRLGLPAMGLALGAGLLTALDSFLPMCSLRACLVLLF
jgi:hypothetical protein